MARFLKVFAESKVSVREWDGSMVASGQVKCKSELAKLEKMEDPLKRMVVTNAAGPVTSNGASGDVGTGDTLRFLRKRGGDDGGGTQSRGRGIGEGSSTRHRHSHNQHYRAKDKRTRVPERELMWGDLWGG